MTKSCFLSYSERKWEKADTIFLKFSWFASIAAEFRLARSRSAFTMITCKGSIASQQGKKMECPTCGVENLETCEFCPQCGARLVLECPHCGSSNHASNEFCNTCHSSLTLISEPELQDFSFEEKLAGMRPLLPRGLAKRASSTEGRLKGERRQITAMFCDCRDFGSGAGRREQEETSEYVEQMGEILVRKALDYGGTVFEIPKGIILVLFGVPLVLEDSPQRAIQSALAMHREVTRFSARITSRGNMARIDLRIGINTGPVVVGATNDLVGLELSYAGDTVEIASKIARLAATGTICVTEETYKLTQGFFRFESLEGLHMGTGAGRVGIYRVIAPSGSRTRFDVSAVQGLTAFVGRKRELDLLLDSFERAKGGKGQALFIGGEAGVGKSRLLYEFRKAVANEDVTFLEGKCLSYGRNRSYHPIIDIIKATFDVQDEDADADIREKVEAGLKALDMNGSWALPYLLGLLSVRRGHIETIFTSPEARRDRLIETVKRIFLKSSQVRPLIIAVEDVHWLDRGSEDVAGYLLDSIAEARILVIFTYRPCFMQPWESRSFHRRIELTPLSEWERPVMVAHVLGGGCTDGDLERLILQKTEGVPFFIEEFIKSLKDLNIIEMKENVYHLATDLRPLTVPSTVRDVILARVDALPKRSKEVIQTSSVMENEFSYEVIKEITRLPDHELVSHLSLLKNSELLYERGTSPDSTYIFRHELTREVIYESILESARKTLHRKIADATERVYRENLDEHFGILCEHYSAAESAEKSAEYARLAGRWAKKIGSPTDAIAYAVKRVEALEKLPRKPQVQQKLIDARIVLAVNMEQNNYFVEAKEAIDPVMDQALMTDDKKRLSHIHTITGSYYSFVEEDLSRGLKDLETSLQMSRDANDTVAMIQAHVLLGFGLCLACEFAKGFQYIHQALGICEAAGNLRGVSIMKSNISFFVYYFQGKIDLALQTSEEAVRIADDLDDTFAQSSADVCHGVSLYAKGLLPEAIHNLLKGAERCERLNSLAWSGLAHHFLGELYFEVGEYSKSVRHYDKAFHLLTRNKVLPSWTIVHKTGRAMAEAMTGNWGGGLQALTACISENRLKWGEGWMRRYMGRMLANLGEPYLSHAERWFEEAIEADRRNGILFHLGLDHLHFADLCTRKGDGRRAGENLLAAKQIMEECGAREWLRRAVEHQKALA